MGKNDSIMADRGFLIAACQGGFIAPHVWEIAGRKDLTIFKSCHYSWFYMIISSSFLYILRHIFLSLSISGTVKAERNTFYKCVYEYKDVCHVWHKQASKKK